MSSFPAAFLAEFFHNHGTLQFIDRPQWKTVAGGSRSYVSALAAPFAERAWVRSPVRRIARDAEGVTVRLDDGESRFDEVVIAAHSDQALAMIDSPSAAEHEILGAIPYQANEALLHTDESLMPRRRAAWASWNFHLMKEPARTTLTYDMNRLQRLDASETNFLVTLNRRDEIDPGKILTSRSYTHPVFTNDGLRAQERWSEISGAERIHFCGAYWRWGFHEDGCWSGLRAAEALGGRGPGLDGAVPPSVGDSPGSERRLEAVR
jgi:predicted NAD/FAD-binding protein